MGSMPSTSLIDARPPSLDLDDEPSVGAGRMAMRLVSSLALVGAIASALPAQVEASQARDHRWAGSVERGTDGGGVAGAVVTAVCATDHGLDARWGTTDDLFTAPVSTATDEDGRYSLELRGGACWSYVAPPAGFERVDTRDANTAQSVDLGDTALRSRTLVVPTSETRSVTTAATGAAVGDVIWDDHDGNGVRDGGELGIAGVVVTLYDGAGRVVETAVSRNDGSYRFDGIPSGDYRVGVSNLPEGYLFTANAVGADHTVDSDADPVTGRSALVAVDDGVHGHLVDVGLRPATGDPVSQRSEAVFPAPPADQIAEVDQTGSTLSLVVLTLIGILAASLLAGLARPRRSAVV
jgi:hypothetical protein